MAIVTFGGGVAGIRGTIAGVTFSANKAGPHARMWSRGANVRSTLQTAERANLSTLAATWRTIGAPDRAAWDAYASNILQRLTNSLGQYYYISGFLWFVKLSRCLATCGRPPILTISPFGAPAAPTILTLVVSAGAVPCAITYAGGEFDPTYDCVIQLALANSIGPIVKPITPLILKGAQTPPGTSLDFTTELADRFGPVTIGMKAFAEVCRQELWGRRSAPFAISVHVVA